MDQTPAESAPTPMEIEISPEGGIIPQQVQETHSAPKQRRMSATDYLGMLITMCVIKPFMIHVCTILSLILYTALC